MVKGTRRWRVRVGFTAKPWIGIGVFWRVETLDNFDPPQRLFTIFICPIPCVPIVVMWRKR